METDDDLIQACRRGDNLAWKRLLDRYERFVCSIPLYYGLDMDDAADVTQITFLILLQSLDELRDDTRLAPWLATVARRHTWRRLAHNRREHVHPEEDLAENELLGYSTGQDGFDPIKQWERIEWINNSLNLLDERCRELLLALYFSGEQPTYAEIARRFKMPVGSVGPTRARCLERLKWIMTRTLQV